MRALGTCVGSGLAMSSEFPFVLFLHLETIQQYEILFLQMKNGPRLLSFNLLNILPPQIMLF